MGTLHAGLYGHPPRHTDDAPLRRTAVTAPQTPSSAPTQAPLASDAGSGYSVQPFRAADWPLVRRMLLQGYPDTPTALWDRGFQRLQAVPPMAPDPSLGVLLCLQDDVVGVALMFPSLRPGQAGPTRRVNASSWAIMPDARSRALWMARHTLADADTTYTALTPIPSAARMLQRIGFAPISHQCLLAPTWRLRQLAPPGTRGPARALLGAAALQALRDDPLAAALHDHHRLDCLVMALDTGDALVPLVWRSRRRLRLLRSAELLYTPSQALVCQHVGTLASALWRHGWPLMEFEAQEDLVPEFPTTRLFQRRFARGPYPAKGVDHLYSELVYLHR